MIYMGQINPKRFESNQWKLPIVVRRKSSARNETSPIVNGKSSVHYGGFPMGLDLEIFPT